MKNKYLTLLLFLILTSQAFAQKFYLGDKIYPSTKEFQNLGASSQTNVTTYRYLGKITDEYFYNRKIGEIIIGVKNNIIVTTIYNLIPEPGDVGVPRTTLDLIESNLPFPLSYKDGFYGVSIDNTNITVSRTKNALTFHKDRIMFFTSVRNSLLKDN